MRVNQQYDEDIKCINGKCYRLAPLDPLYPYLFYRNRDVQKHNKKMLSHVNEELILLDVIEESHSKEIGNVEYEKTMRLLSRFLIKCNILVELYAGKCNTEYGLINGADGICKNI